MNIASSLSHVELHKSWRSRAKPLLGTLVEISLPCDPYDGEAAFVRATDIAFSRIEAIHHAMSFHEVTSDLRTIARAAVDEIVTVTPDTWKTLLLAAEVERDSHGVFNVTIAPQLVARRRLPAPDALTNPSSATLLASSIALEPTNQLRVLQPVWIDLGGIAKGYAVDAAVVALQSAGVTAGVVNAGGDLRVFGSVWHKLALRIPATPTVNIEVAELQDLSCATSGGYFSADAHTSVPDQHPAIIGNRAQSMVDVASVSVIASSCAVADALTKVVWLCGIDDSMCTKLLARHSALTVMFDAQGLELVRK